MFGNKKNNDNYANYNKYTNYNNGYGGVDGDNYNSYNNNNYQQGYGNYKVNQYNDMQYSDNYGQYNSEPQENMYQNNIYNDYNKGHEENIIQNSDYNNQRYQEDMMQNGNYNDRRYQEDIMQNGNYNDRRYQEDMIQNGIYHDKGYQEDVIQNRDYNNQIYQEDIIQDEDYQEDVIQDKDYLNKEHQEDIIQDGNYDNKDTSRFDTQDINEQLMHEEYDDYYDDEYIDAEDMSYDEYYSDEGYFVNPIQPSNSHAMLTKVFMMVGVCLIGLICGSLTDTAFRKFWMQNIESDSLIKEAMKVMVIILYTYMISNIHIILHELGHYIGGVVTDYSLICFRVFGITFVKEGDKTSVKKYGVPGTVGECTMMPPESINGKYPYMLYNLGGILMNFLTSVIALVVLTKAGFAKQYPYSMLLTVFVVIGIITILYNGIPLVINGIPNDGYTLLHMFKSKDARIAVHSHLLINAYLARGGRYSDIPFQQFYKNVGGNYSGHLWVKVKLMEYRWHLEHLNFAKAAECINVLDYSFKKLPRVYQYEINSEKMFLEMMGDCNLNVVEKLYSIDIKNYIYDTLGMMSSIRIMMAYEACVTCDLRAANKYYNLLKKAAKSEPLKGECDLELMLGTYIYERFCIV